jgi:hypothetical protein
VRVLARCMPLLHLRVCRWPYRHPEALAELSVETLAFVGGSLESLHGLRCKQLRTIWLLDCRKLEKIGMGRFGNLRVDACNRLNHDTLGDVQGIESISLTSQRRLKSVEFLSRCPILRSLSMSACPLRSVADWSPLHNHGRLESAWLTSGISDEQLTDMSKSNPHVALCNGNTYCLAGRTILREQYVSIHWKDPPIYPEGGPV